MLREIPYGETKTYGQLAQDLSCGSAQAVGQAVGRNPLTILVPCHRVMGKDGQLTGYASGLDRKRWLYTMKELHLEGEIKPMYTFIEYPKCSTCRKAKSELDGLQCEFQSQNIVTETPTSQELQNGWQLLAYRSSLSSILAG